MTSPFLGLERSSFPDERWARRDWFRDAFGGLGVVFVSASLEQSVRELRGDFKTFATNGNQPRSREELLYRDSVVFRLLRAAEAKETPERVVRKRGCFSVMTESVCFQVASDMETVKD